MTHGASFCSFASHPLASASAPPDRVPVCRSRSRALEPPRTALSRATPRTADACRFLPHGVSRKGLPAIFSVSITKSETSQLGSISPMPTNSKNHVSLRT